jgi:hypothetical protein
MTNYTTSQRHPEADRNPVAIERSDAIDAAAGLYLMARENRRAAKLRQNAGPHNADHRRWLRTTAATYEAAAGRIQRAADDAI